MVHSHPCFKQQVGQLFGTLSAQLGSTPLLCQCRWEITWTMGSKCSGCSIPPFDRSSAAAPGDLCVTHLSQHDFTDISSTVQTTSATAAVVLANCTHMTRHNTSIFHVVTGSLAAVSSSFSASCFSSCTICMHLLNSACLLLLLLAPVATPSSTLIGCPAASVGSSP